QAIRESQDLRTELTKLQDLEQQIESYKIQIIELENQNRTKTNEFTEKDEQIQKLSKENRELHQQI
ncbi:unnamed protein product, partial [Rotaria magnacalcarata]